MPQRLFTTFSPIRKFTIRDLSMEPSLMAGDEVLVIRFMPININDIVVFKHENKNLIKRVKEKKQNKYFLEGDNKNYSRDSREFGWISRRDIIGKVLTVIK